MVALPALLFSALSVADPHQSGDIILRGGLSSVVVDSGSSSITIPANDPVISPNTLSVDNGTQVAFNFVYFFNRHWAFEFNTATPSAHDIQLQNSTTSVNVAEVSQIPLTFSALYYPDKSWDFKPYVGVGVNYSYFLSEKFNGAAADFDYKDLGFDNSFDLAFQVGADYQINSAWSVNVSARYVGANTKAAFTVGSVNETSGFSKIDMNPWIYSLMVGYQF